jgi:hypothetical protein
MVKILILLPLFCFINVPSYAQVGSVKAEQFKSKFETTQSIEDVSDYDGPQIPIALLNIGISEEVFRLYPYLQDARIGLGVTNMVIEYLEWTNRFTFVEEKSEIKERMTSQWKASKAGVSENEVYGFGKVKLAKYFVTIEVYDFSVSEDEVLRIKDGVTQTQITRLGLQVRFTDAVDGTYFVGSGLGEASTVKQSTLLGNDIEEVNFRQSAIGVTTRKALETASSRIVSRMIRRNIFEN